MNISISIPDDIAQELTEQFGDLSRHVLEALAADGCRRGVFTSAEVQRLLGLSSRFEAACFLEKRRAFPGYDEEDLAADRETWQKLRRS